MSKYKIKKITSKKVWESYLLNQKPGTFLQSWNWGEVNQEVGYKVYRFGFYDGNKLVGLCQIIDQPAKRGHHLLIPGGPVINYENLKLFSFVTGFLKKLALESGAWFVRIRPDIGETEKNVELLDKHGYVSSPMHVHGENTLILKIDRDEEEILKEMRKNTRYSIRKSLNEGFIMTYTKNPNKSEILETLQEETVKRHHFIGFSKKLFRAQIKYFGKDNQAELFITKHNNEPQVAAIIIYYGEKAFYHHSGSSESARKSNASYFTQWQIIKRAKKLGIKYYDFWGIAPTDNPKHRFHGVTVFKRGFSGEQKNWLHARDLPIKRIYYMTYIFETLRRFIRRL